MSDREIDKSRRRFLIGATSVVGGVGVVGFAVPFVQSWSPSAKARAVGAPIKIDISKLEPGQMLGPIPAWRGKPIFVVYRTPEMLASLAAGGDLADPESTRKQQPDYAVNVHRSRKPEVGIYLGLCTHLGCSPKFDASASQFVKLEPTKGGFFCPCHGSAFDLAGRVYAGVPAPANLEVPPYSFESDSVVVIGVDEGTG